MRSPCNLSFVTLIIILHLFLFARGDEDLIQKTCEDTRNYELCVQVLESEPSSRSAGDVASLAGIVASVEAAISYLIRQFDGTPATDLTLKNALALGRSVAVQQVSKDLRLSNYKSAQENMNSTHTSSGDCQQVFRQNPTLIYPSELASRQRALEGLASVGFDILIQLPNSSL